MDKMLASSELLKHVIYYADDIMIATNKSLSHHIEIIDKVLQCFSTANIKIKAQKMSIAKPEVEFLGIIWRQGRLHIPSARIQAFKNVPIPKTPKKVKSFVCAMSYYRKFIPKFAELAKPLMDLSSLHPTQFKWLPIHQQSFDNMIRAIEINTSLNLPDPQKPFFVQTDASDVAGAGRVFQKDDQGNEL
jgi:hypothetical protein